MSVTISRAKLHTALKEFRAHWAEAEMRWKDAVAREFEEQFWNPLEGATLSTIAALDRLAQVLLQVQQDCGQDGGWSDRGPDQG